MKIWQEHLAHKFKLHLQLQILLSADDQVVISNVEDIYKDKILEQVHTFNNLHYNVS